METPSSSPPDANEPSTRRTSKHFGTVLRKKDKRKSVHRRTVARDFCPKKDEFPKDDEINPALELKLDIIIVYLDRLRDLGCCIIPLLGLIGLTLLGLLTVFITRIPGGGALIPSPPLTSVVERTVVVTATKMKIPPSATFTEALTEAPLTEAPLTPTFTPQPCLTFRDPPEDTFNRNTNQPAGELAPADIQSLTICATNSVVTLTVGMADSFQPGHFSYAVNMRLTHESERPRNFLYQMHDGQPTIGEVNANFQVIPTTPVTLTYSAEKSALTVVFPTSEVMKLNPFTVFLESFFMETPSSIWGGDETEVYGPVDILPLLPPGFSGVPPEVANLPMLLAENPTFCRGEPNVESGEKWTLNPGDIVPVVGMYDGWYLVKIDDPRTRTQCCWVGAGSIQGDASLIPLIPMEDFPEPGSCP